jgi:D-lactate dehydrogenase
MNIAVFSAKPYDRRFFDAAHAPHPQGLVYFEPRLMPATVTLARGFPAVCAFVNDELDAAVLTALYAVADFAAGRPLKFALVAAPAAAEAQE